MLIRLNFLGVATLGLNHSYVFLEEFFTISHHPILKEKHLQNFHKTMSREVGLQL
jgi:hypothetical protein